MGAVAAGIGTQVAVFVVEELVIRNAIVPPETPGTLSASAIQKPCSTVINFFMCFLLSFLVLCLSGQPEQTVSMYNLFYYTRF